MADETTMFVSCAEDSCDAPMHHGVWLPLNFPVSEALLVVGSIAGVERDLVEFLDAQSPRVLDSDGIGLFRSELADALLRDFAIGLRHVGVERADCRVALLPDEPALRALTGIDAATAQRVDYGGSESRSLWRRKHDAQQPMEILRSEVSFAFLAHLGAAGSLARQPDVVLSATQAMVYSPRCLRSVAHLLHAYTANERHSASYPRISIAARRIAIAATEPNRVTDALAMMQWADPVSLQHHRHAIDDAEVEESAAVEESVHRRGSSPDAITPSRGSADAPPRSSLSATRTDTTPGASNSNDGPTLGRCQISVDPEPSPRRKLASALGPQPHRPTGTARVASGSNASAAKPSTRRVSHADTPAPVLTVASSSRTARDPVPVAAFIEYERPRGLGCTDKVYVPVRQGAPSDAQERAWWVRTGPVPDFQSP